MLTLLDDISKALAFLEKIGVAHRHIKPSNIMKDQKNKQYKIFGFGF